MPAPARDSAAAGDCRPAAANRRRLPAAARHPRETAQSRSEPLRDHDVQVFVALDEGRVGPLGLGDLFDHREALQDTFPDDLELELGQAVADAAVDAEAERDVAARILAVDDIVVRPLDHLVVAVARDVPNHDLSALFAPPAPA